MLTGSSRRPCRGVAFPSPGDLGIFASANAAMDSSPGARGHAADFAVFGFFVSGIFASEFSASDFFASEFFASEFSVSGLTSDFFRRPLVSVTLF